MDPLVLAAASAVVTAMATDGWQQARAAVVKLWQRGRPDHLPAIEADLDDTHAEVATARAAGDGPAEEGLVSDWQRKLRRLLEADPDLRIELRQVLDNELIPLLPAGEQARVQNIQNITASAQGATAQGAMFGNVINYGAGPGNGLSDALPATDPGEEDAEGRR
ncbi:hypothetical protein [Streptomyces chartreusis]|uniref:hypothetical protein n=1 Tax=Streptomyces chartreusis TaxID=1969 RepID=UPI0037FA0026